MLDLRLLEVGYFGEWSENTAARPSSHVTRITSQQAHIKMGVFTQVASNIKRFACKSVYASCVNGPSGPKGRTYNFGAGSPFDKNFGFVLFFWIHIRA